MEEPPNDVAAETTSHAITYVIDAGDRHVSCYINNRVRLGVVGIQLMNPHNDRSMDIYALLDSACDTTMISEAVAKELGFMGVQMPIEIEGLTQYYSTRYT